MDCLKRRKKKEILLLREKTDERFLLKSNKLNKPLFKMDTVMFCYRVLCKFSFQGLLMDCWYMLKVYTQPSVPKQVQCIDILTMKFNLLVREMRLLDKPTQKAGCNGQRNGYNGKKTGYNGQKTLNLHRAYRLRDF